jgi:type II secretory pathway component GspD/PulD (secretin)
MGGPNGGGDETFTITGDQVSLQFPNNPVADLLSIYERLTGKTLVKDTNIFEGASISLVTPKPVLKDEAVKLIEATLLTNGYAIVADPDGKSTRILPTRGQGVSSMQFSAGVNFYTSEKDIPEGETLITYFMKLDFLDPTEGQEILANHIGLNVYGRITPVLTPPGLLITESATIVKQLISIRAAIDVGDTGSSLVTKFIPVVYADAGTVAQIIQSTISAQATERETKGIKTVRPYDVLAGISGDAYTPETFADFCAEYGYESDSIKALQTFRRCSAFAKRLRAFFTEAELEQLQEIN